MTMNQFNDTLVDVSLKVFDVVIAIGLVLLSAFVIFVQLAKAFVQGNFANVGKYIFYIINAFGAQFIWDDSEEK